VKFTAKATYTYIPKFNGNRGLPEKEQIKVEIIRPKVEEREALFHFDLAPEGGTDGMALKQQSDVGRALRRHVGKIENLTADYGDGKETPIPAGKDLAEAPLFGAGGLVTELFLEIVSDTLREDEKKTSASPSS
jgi:hypothetical protein